MLQAAVGKLNFNCCLFSGVIMLLKMAYQSLSEVHATSGEYIKREIVVLLSTFSPWMTNFGNSKKARPDQPIVVKESAS